MLDNLGVKMIYFAVTRILRVRRRPRLDTVSAPDFQ